jgi:TRAP-type C4-dicarboxylate transport system permease small subunit
VTIVLEAVSRRVRIWLEGWCLLTGLVITVYFLVFSVELTWDSFVFGDKSDGLLAIPLWIPQLPMVIGTFSLALRLVDELVILVRTGEPVHLKSGEEKYLERMLKEESDFDRVGRER